MFYVYALRDIETGAIKIGRSTNPDARKYALEFGLHRDLETVRLYVYKTYNAHLCVEHYLHAKCKELRHPKFRGKEWFTADVEAMLPKHVNSKFAANWLYMHNKPTIHRCRKAWSVRLGKYVMVYKDTIVSTDDLVLKKATRSF